MSEIAAAVLGAAVIASGSAAWAQQGNGGAGNGAAAGAGAAGNANGASAAPGANTGSAGSAGAGVSGAPGSNTGAAGVGAANGPAATNSPNAGTAPANAGAAPANGGVNAMNGNAAQGNGAASSGTLGNTSSGNVAGSTIAGVKGTNWDLPRTIAAALESSSALQIAKRNTEIDQKRADQQADAGKPSIDGRASATRFDQATKVAIGAGPPVQVLGAHTETLEIGISQRIDFTGQIRAAADQETLQKLADQFQVQRIQNDRSLRAETVYYNLLRAQHQVQVAQANLTTAREQQRIALQLNSQQVGQKVDVLRANTQVANALTELKRAQNNAGIAGVNFNDLVGQPLGTEVVLEDVSGVTAGGPATAGTPAQDIPLFASPTADVDAIDVAKDLQAAYGRRPDLLSQQVNVRVAEKGVKLAHAGLEPDLRLNASGDYYPTTSFQTPRQRTAAVTVSITLPFYDGGLTRDRVSEAKLRTENARTTLDSLKSDVNLDVSQSYLNLTTAAAQIDNANSALQQAIKTRDLALLRYRGEVALYLEVTDAQAALQAAENNQINAVYDYQVAWAQYRHALGVPADGPTL